MLKLRENPPMQWPEPMPLERLEGLWWVAHCKPRQEKALAWDILRSGGHYFLPMYDKTLRSRGRTWRSRAVLFPGYLFFCGQEAQRLMALQTQRVVRWIEVSDQRQLVGELTGIGRVLAADLPVGSVAKLVKGATCRIAAGPLEGLEGVVEHRKGRTRFVLTVSLLGQGAAVEVDAGLIERL